MAPKDENSWFELTENSMGVRESTEIGLDSKDSLVVEVVSLVSEAKGIEPLELPPLAETIDPEAIERILESDVNESATVRFEYAGCEIGVTANGEIFVLSSQ